MIGFRNRYSDLDLSWLPGLNREVHKLTAILSPRLQLIHTLPLI